MRLEKIRIEKEKKLETKATEKEKLRKESEKSFNFYKTKNTQRKRDQELNLTKLQKRMENFKMKIIEKCKDNDSDFRSRSSLDIYQIKAKLEADLRKNI